VLVNGGCEKLSLLTLITEMNHERVNGMKVKSVFLIAFFLGFLLFVYGFSSQAQQPTKSITILYSNNINGEIDPCPT
jgi:hypothetical protein